MSGVVIPDPRGGHVWIYGVDGDGNPVKLLVGTDGHLQVDTLTSALPTGAATSAKQDTVIGHVDGIEGLLGGGLPSALDTDSVKVKEQSPISGFATSAKQDSLLTELGAKLETADVGIEATTKYLKVERTGTLVRDRASDTNAAVTYDELSTTAVPTGKIWWVVDVVAYDVNSSITRIDLYTTDGTTSRLMGQFWPTAANEALVWVGEMPLPAGYKLLVAFTGTVAGDDIYVDVHAIEMAA